MDVTCMVIKARVGSLVVHVRTLEDVAPQLVAMQKKLEYFISTIIEFWKNAFIVTKARTSLANLIDTFKKYGTKLKYQLHDLQQHLLHFPNQCTTHTKHLNVPSTKNAMD